MVYAASDMIFGFPIEITAQQVGKDWRLCVAGGEVPHVGAVSLAWPQNGEIEVYSIIRPTHKDHIVGEKLARAVVEATGNAASVEAGIHYDDLTKDEITQVVDLAEQLAQVIIKQLLRSSISDIGD